MGKQTDKPEVTRRCFKFRAYPNRGTQRRLYNVMRRAATPVWNACIAEREQARQLYRQRLDEAFSDAVYDLRRDLTPEEETAIRRAIAKEIGWPTAYSQYKHVRKRDHPEYGQYNAQMLQCVIAQADTSEKSFLALWQKGNRDARPPKQTHLHRCLTFRQSGWKLEDDRVTLAGIGTIRLRMHRPVEGKVKTVTIRQTRTGKWHVCFSCELTNFQGSCGPLSQPKPCVPHGLRQKHAPSGGSDPNLGGAHNFVLVWSLCTTGGSDPNLGGAHNSGQRMSGLVPGGSDPNLGGAHNTPGRRTAREGGGSDPNLGGAHNGVQRVEIHFPDDGFIADSAGYEIPHPQFYTSELAKLRRLSRSLSRKRTRTPNAKPNGSTRRGGTQPCLGRNRRRARLALAKWHERIAGRREYFLWHVANYYARNYREVIVWTRPAKPPIQYAIESKTARRLCDGAYAKFLNMLRQKCEQYKTTIQVKENPEWQEQKEQLREIATLETLQPILRKAKRAVRQNRRGRLQSLARDCARAATRRI